MANKIKLEIKVFSKSKREKESKRRIDYIILDNSLTTFYFGKELLACYRKTVQQKQEMPRIRVRAYSE